MRKRRRPHAGSRRSHRHWNLRKLGIQPLETRRLLAVDATMRLGEAAFDNNLASFDIQLDLQTTADEVLVYFSIDFAPSSTNLIAAGPDFSAFSFAPAAPLLDTWRQIGFLNDPGFESSIEYDDSLVGALPAGSYTLGTLEVDLAAVGLTSASPFSVSIAGLDTAIGVVDSAEGFRFEPVSFDPPSRQQLAVQLSAPAAVDEGVPLALTIEPQIMIDGSFLVDWGDGQQETIAAADLPADGTVLHSYADGDSVFNLSVTLQNGTSALIGEFEISVTNVAPTIELSGPATIGEGELFTLNLGSVADPGDDTVVQYVIAWGDGQRETIEAAELPASREVTHRYQDGDSVATIEVDLEDEDGLHPAAGSHAVTIANVSPTVVLDSPSLVQEGAEFRLLIGPPADPGADTVTEYRIDWGDGQQETFLADELPGGGVSHAYADGQTAATIVVDLVDEDGVHLAAGTRTVMVENVPPTVPLTGASASDEGAPFILTIGSITDPGQDEVVQYVIRWGDGEQQVIPASSLPQDRQVVHTYADGEFLASIEVDLIDEDGTHPAAGSFTVAVRNVAPTIVVSGAAEAQIEQPYSITLGPVSDPGSDTVSLYTIDWGDGQIDDVAAADLPASGQLQHTYSSGGAAAAIQIQIVDEDGRHPNAGNLSVFVIDAPPAVTLSGPPTIVEGTDYPLTISPVMGPRRDAARQLLIDWGDQQQETLAIDDPDAAHSLSHTYVDGPATRTISVDLLDQNANFLSRATLEINVLGGAPTIEGFFNSASVPGETDTGETVIARLEFSDPGVRDTHTAVIDWGDGSLLETAVVAEQDGVGTATAEHQYAVGGVYTLSVELSDTEGNMVAAETIAYVTGYRISDGVLQIVGSEGNDVITAAPERSAGMFVDMTLPHLGNFRLSFPLAEVLGIDVYVGAGHDRVMISERILVDSYLDGGPGSDHVQGGDGRNIIQGGDGDDRILGGQDRDILVGGAGEDLILAYGGDDLLAGPDWQNPLQARGAVFQIWGSNASFESRFESLTGSLQLIADSAADKLFGGPGNNVFLVSGNDGFEDRESHTPYTLGDAIARGWSELHPGSPGVYNVVVDRPTPPAGVTTTTAATAVAAAAAQREGEGFRFSKLDVNHDGSITPMDVIAVINHINRYGPGRDSTGTEQLDASGDGWISPDDVLAIVNSINTSVRDLAAGERVRRQEKALHSRDELLGLENRQDERAVAVLPREGAWGANSDLPHTGPAEDEWRLEPLLSEPDNGDLLELLAIDAAIAK